MPVMESPQSALKARLTPRAISNAALFETAPYVPSVLSVTPRNFFFAAFEDRILHSPVNLYNAKLPGPALLAGNFSQVSDSAKPKVPAGTVLTPAEISSDTVGGLGLQFIQIPQRL